MKVPAVTDIFLSRRRRLSSNAHEHEIDGEHAGSDPKDSGAVMVLHKVKEDRHIYFIANTTAAAVDGQMALRGALKLEAWDPHCGAIYPVDQVAAEVGRVPVTRIRVRLSPGRSLFLVGTMLLE